ncbi:MAG: cytochrome b5 domain-containing protein [Ectothiorhodospira sp.]
MKALPALIALVLPYGFALAAEPPDKGASPIPMEEVARHHHREDCWMAIDGQVYDVTDYLPRHPGPLEIVLEWCGREATQGWETRGNEEMPQAHSRGAHYLLKRYHLGPLITEEDSQEDPTE